MSNREAYCEAAGEAGWDRIHASLIVWSYELNEILDEPDATLYGSERPLIQRAARQTMQAANNLQRFAGREAGRTYGSYPALPVHRAES